MCVQAAAFRDAYAPLLAGVNHGFCSPVARTTTTAKLLGFGEAKPVEDLYFGNFITDEMRAMDREFGYAPVSEYLKKAGPLYVEPSKRMHSRSFDPLWARGWVGWGIAYTYKCCYTYKYNMNT